MKAKPINRRSFINYAAVSGLGITLSNSVSAMEARDVPIGIIGLDTSHCIAFTKYINDRSNGYRVVAAYTTVSQDIPSSRDRVEGFTQQMKESGVAIVQSIGQLLEQVDCVLLETVDGRLHRDQAEQVFKSGKRVFIDKPVAASMADVVAIYDAAQAYDVSTFSTSGTRYMSQAQAVRHGSIGEVMGANTFSPISYEPSHSDLYWYGIHGVELLFTVLGTGCERVKRIRTSKYDYAIGVWDGGRVGTFCGIGQGKTGYGGQAFGSDQIIDLGHWEGYDPMIEKILDYFRTGEVPVAPAETLEVYAFMEAAKISSGQNEGWITLESVLQRSGR